MKRRPMCLVCLGLALGIWLMRLSGLPVSGEPKNSRLEALAQSEETVRVRGQVQDYEIKTNSKSYLITSCVLHVQENEIPVKKLYLITQQEELLTIGSEIETEGILEKPETPANPGQFDTASWYAAKGVFYTMWADEIRTVEKAGTGAAEGLKRLRSRIAGNLSAMLPKSQAGILSAMLLGDKTLLDSEVKAAYQTGGVLHVLSISGLHLSMLGMGLFRLLQKTGGISEHDMFNTFNMGVGMCVIVAPEDADRAMEILRSQGEQVTVIGEVVPRGESEIEIC